MLNHSQNVWEHFVGENLGKVFKKKKKVGKSDFLGGSKIEGHPNHTKIESLEKSEMSKPVSFI